MASHRSRQKSPPAKKSWPSGVHHDYRSAGVNASIDLHYGQYKHPDNYTSSPHFSQESSGITPVPTNYHYKDSATHQKEYQSLSGFGIMDTECYFDLPSVAASDLQRSLTEISQAYMARQDHAQRVYKPHDSRTTDGHSAPAQIAATHRQDQYKTHTENILPRNVCRKLTQILQAKIATEGTYTEEGFVRLFTSLYFSNAALNKRALVAYIEEMASAFAVSDPLRIIRERNLAHGLDIFGKSIADAGIPLPKDPSNDSISIAADKLLLHALKHTSNNSHALPNNRSQGVPVSLPTLSNTQAIGPKLASPLRNSPNLHTLSSQSAPTHNGLNTDSTLKVSSLATPVCPPLVQSKKQSQQSVSQTPPATLQEQFQRILEYQAIQQAQQQAQIQLLQQQLCIQQELQQQQLLEHQISNEKAKNLEYINYLHNHRQVEPFPHYARVPTASMPVPRSTTVATSRATGGVGVFKMPIRKRQIGNSNYMTNRLNISPDRAHISGRQQQLLYECRSRAQELADILLSNKVANSQAGLDIAQIDWNQFTYSKELEAKQENNQIHDISEQSSHQMDTQTSMQSNAIKIPAQIPVVVVEELDKAVQNTIQEELADTPILLSKCKPRRAGTPLLYREGITTILSHDDDEDTDPNIIRGLMSRERSRLGRRYIAPEVDYCQHSVDIGINLEADSVILDGVATTDHSSTNRPCVGNK